MISTRRRLLGLGLPLLLIAGFGAFTLFSPSPPKDLSDRTQWLAQGPSLPPFTLPGKPQTFDNSSLAGHWTIVLFGYTHCPDVCPTDLGIIASVLRQRRQEHLLLPQVLFISVDPARDNLDMLAHYAAAFDPTIMVAQADEQAIKPFTLTLGVYALRHLDEKDASGNYPVDHSTSLYLFNPSSELQASFQMPQTPTDLSRQLKAILHDH